jgi:hypothetical protein
VTRVRLVLPGPDPARSPGGVEVHDLPVPGTGAIVAVHARAPHGGAVTKLATMFIVGSSERTAERPYTLSASMECAPPDAAALAAAEQVEALVLVHPPGGPTATHGPFPLEIVASAG